MLEGNIPSKPFGMQVIFARISHDVQINVWAATR
jgi:hypothetical protein